MLKNRKISCVCILYHRQTIVSCTHLEKRQRKNASKFLSNHADRQTKRQTGIKNMTFMEEEVITADADVQKLSIWS